MKPFVARLYVILMIPLIVSACGVRDARYSPRGLAIRGGVLPPDVLGPVSGLHPTSKSDDVAVMCCGIDGSASFRVKKSIARPRKLVVSLYWPDAEANALPMLEIRVGEHGQRSTFAIRHSGFNTVSVRLRSREVLKSLRGRAILVSLNFVRSGAKIARSNAAILTSAYFE